MSIMNESMGSLKIEEEEEEEVGSGSIKSNDQNSMEYKTTPPPKPSENMASLNHVEIQSPAENALLWDPYFCDQVEEADFMVFSPVRNSNNYNFGHGLMGCSPPRFSSPLGPNYNTSSTKGKGLSPLHKVFNSPNNQYMQIENLSSLSTLDNLLDDSFLKVDHHDIAGGGGGCSSDFFDHLNFPDLLDCLTLPTSSCRLTETSSSSSSSVQLMLDNHHHANYQMTPPDFAPLSQQLQRERLQEDQQQQPPLLRPHQSHNINQSLILQHTMGPEQV